MNPELQNILPAYATLPQVATIGAGGSVLSVLLALGLSLHLSSSTANVSKTSSN